MREITVRDARRDFRELLDRVAAGEEVLLTRRGKAVARLSPPGAVKPKALPRLAHFRSTLEVRGRALSQEVAAARREERY